MRVFVTGGTGFIGSALGAALCARGDSVVVLSRNLSRVPASPPRGAEFVGGDPTQPASWKDKIRGCDAVVHLAGESVAGQRWTDSFKQSLRDSRVASARHLVDAIAEMSAGERPRILVSASGIDYYPPAEDASAGKSSTDDQPVDESGSQGQSFLARLCGDWEHEAKRAEECAVRVVMMRTGLVLGAGGPLDKLSQPFRFFTGGPIGSGRQWTTWIHIEDAVRAYLFALEHEKLSGPTNLVSPNPVRNREFSRALGRALNRPSWLPVPGPVLRLVLGEFSEYVLTGRRAIPRRLLEAGFDFGYPLLDDAFAALL
jgi:uncharacterized protein (TIGR01777 family)